MPKGIKIIFFLTVVRMMTLSPLVQADDASNKSEENISAEDLAIIQNMDLLENLDQLEEDPQMLSELDKMGDNNE